MGARTQQSWAKHAREVLDAARHRQGGARNAIIELLGRQECALTALEIEERLRASDRAVGRASVYRVLELLVETRLVQRLDMGEGIARYERIDPSGDHHHHLLCEQCGRLIPFDDHQLERSIDQMASRLGIRIDDHEIVLRGACASCR